MRAPLAFAAVALVAACRTEVPVIDAGCDGALFGQPVAMTGLDGTQCTGTCACSGFTSRDFTAAQLEALEGWTLTQPFEPLAADPYQEPVPEHGPAVCAVVVEDLAAKRYRVETFADEAAVAAAGAILTHHDACGRCSTLKDFVVYAKDRDIGAPVKKCGFDNFGQPVEKLAACIEGLGFTPPCAQIWAWNVRFTQGKCLEPCLFIGDGAYHHADGSLNACLSCDEKHSGPVFKAVAGRTRRNTGLASSICRPCSEARPVAHAYPGLE